MTDTTAMTTTIATPDAVSTATTTKPGWKTSEFWLKLAALALTALYASGLLTTSTALAIAGIAATMLGALGYTVSRTFVKAGALFLLVVLGLGATQIACTTGTRDALVTDAKDAGKKFLDCAKPAAANAALELVPAFANILQNATGDGGKVDWAPVNAVAKPLTSTASQCAFSSALAEVLHPKAKPGAPQSSPLVADPAGVRAGFAAIRETWGVAGVKLADGATL